MFRADALRTLANLRPFRAGRLSSNTLQAAINTKTQARRIRVRRARSLAIALSFVTKHGVLKGPVAEVPQEGGAAESGLAREGSTGKVRPSRSAIACRTAS